MALLTAVTDAVRLTTVLVRTRLRWSADCCMGRDRQDRGWRDAVWLGN